MIKTKYVSQQGGSVSETTFEVEIKDFYDTISQKLADEDFEKGLVKVKISTDDGEANYTVKARSGTRCITELDNTFPTTYLVAGLKPKHLKCISAVKNAYKFYKLVPILGTEAKYTWDHMSESDKKFLIDSNVKEGDPLIKASWGRIAIGSGELWGEISCYYPPSMYWIKYKEKMSKGYADHSTLVAEDKTTNVDSVNKNTQKIVKKDGPSLRLFDTLRNFARKAVKCAKIHVPVTTAIINKSKELLNEMKKTQSVEEFNEILLELMVTLERPISTGDGQGVKRMLANSISDFGYILSREEDLIQAMEGTMDGTVPVNSGDFNDYGIEVYVATDKQKESVLRHLSDQLKPKVKSVYRVIPKAQQKRFDSYIKANNISTVKQLWHGSRNENWMSIVQSSLQLNPNAVVTGKMFGQGIYFAPSSMKSWNYTSFRGTSWASGKSDTAFMGLYAVAYGKPYDVNTWSSGTRYERDTKVAGCNCLHAHAGVSLHNDEIVFYDEAAVVLNYIVEFEE